MNTQTNSRTSRASFRRVLAALAALPVLTLAVACGGGGDDGEGAVASGGSDAVATAPGGGASDDASKDSKGGGESGRGKSAFYDAQMEYVQCMRTKGGVKDFPDPKLSGYLDWAKIDKITDPNGHGEEQKGGKGGACNREMQKAMNAEPKRDAQKDYESMLAHAVCMRDKGISDFKNPTMSGGNVIPGGEPDPTNAKIDTDSATYKQAREACEDKLLDGLDGMQ